MTERPRDSTADGLLAGVIVLFVLGTLYVLKDDPKLK